MAVLKKQLAQIPYLKVGASSLGREVGLGLFATQDLELHSDDRPFILCCFFGRVLFLNEIDLQEQYWHDQMFEGQFI
jgi:hypothetical protein